MCVLVTWHVASKNRNFAMFVYMAVFMSVCAIDERSLRHLFLLFSTQLFLTVLAIRLQGFFLLQDLAYFKPVATNFEFL